MGETRRISYSLFGKYSRYLGKYTTEDGKINDII